MCVVCGVCVCGVGVCVVLVCVWCWGVCVCVFSKHSFLDQKVRASRLQFVAGSFTESFGQSLMPRSVTLLVVLCHPLTGEKQKVEKKPMSQGLAQQCELVAA